MKRSAGRPPTPPVTLTRGHLATLAGLGDATSARRSVVPLPPADAPNDRFGLAVAGEWLRAYITAKVEAARPPRAPGELDGAQELARKNAALADKTELENAVRRGTLVQASEVEGEWARILTTIKTRLMQVPHVAAPIVAGETDRHVVAELLADMIRDALTELSAPDDAEAA